MSSSHSSSFTRKMNNGAYHQHLFRTERRNESVVVRNGVTQSIQVDKSQGLTINVGWALTAALSKK